MLDTKVHFGVLLKLHRAVAPTVPRVLDCSYNFKKGLTMSLLQQITYITTYTNLSIEYNRVRIGVCPSGIKPSDLIVQYNSTTEDGLKNALDECISYLKANNKELKIKD